MTEDEKPLKVIVIGCGKQASVLAAEIMVAHCPIEILVIDDSPEVSGRFNDLLPEGLLLGSEPSSLSELSLIAMDEINTKVSIEDKPMDLNIKGRRPRWLKG